MLPLAMAEPTKGRPGGSPAAHSRENQFAAESTRYASPLPSRNHAIVLVSKLHKPTMRALAYAKASRPNVLEAVMVSTDPRERDAIIDEWDRRGIDVPLKILYSPYREITRPIIEFVKSSSEPLELMINNKVIGQGETVKVGENFIVRPSGGQPKAR